MDPKALLETRDAYRIVNKFLAQYRANVFICRNPKFIPNNIGGYYLATADEVMASDCEVVVVLHKDDRLTKYILEKTQDKALVNEIEKILFTNFTEVEVDVVDYAATLFLKGLPTWKPWYGVEPQISRNTIELKVTSPYAYYPKEVREDERYRKFVFEKLVNKWVLSEAPSKYQPQYIEKV